MSSSHAVFVLLLSRIPRGYTPIWHFSTWTTDEPGWLAFDIDGNHCLRRSPVIREAISKVETGRKKSWKRILCKGLSHFCLDEILHCGKNWLNFTKQSLKPWQTISLAENQRYLIQTIFKRNRLSEKKTFFLIFFLCFFLRFILELSLSYLNRQIYSRFYITFHSTPDKVESRRPQRPLFQSVSRWLIMGVVRERTWSFGDVSGGNLSTV